MRRICHLAPSSLQMDTLYFYRHTILLTPGFRPLVTASMRKQPACTLLPFCACTTSTSRATAAVSDASLAQSQDVATYSRCNYCVDVAGVRIGKENVDMVLRGSDWSVTSGHRTFRMIGNRRWMCLDRRHPAKQVLHKLLRCAFRQRVCGGISQLQTSRSRSQSNVHSDSRVLRHASKLKTTVLSVPYFT